MNKARREIRDRFIFVVLSRSASAAAGQRQADDAREFYYEREALKSTGSKSIDFILGGVSEEEIESLRRHEKTGRPLGSDGFVRKLGTPLGRILERQKPGRKRGSNQK